MINILWSEISAKFRLLSITIGFVILNEKAIVPILVAMATEFEEKWNLIEEFY